MNAITDAQERNITQEYEFLTRDQYAQLRKDLADSQLEFKQASGLLDDAHRTIEQLEQDLATETARANCWFEQAELLQRQNDEAFAELRGELAEREAEIAALRKAMQQEINYHFMQAGPKDLPNIKQALSTPPSTSYLEQWEKEKYGEPVAWMFPDDEEYGYIAYQGKPPTQEQIDYLAKWNRPAWLPLYARKD